MKHVDPIEIRYVQNGDRSFWFSLDKHLPLSEFERKVKDKQGYVCFLHGKPIGILRYNLFWDNTPFCTLLCIKENYRRNGFGKELMRYWESEMRALGYSWILVSTQVDEEAQHFYRSIGYSDCGILEAPNQASEIFLRKQLLAIR